MAHGKGMRIILSRVFFCLVLWSCMQQLLVVLFEAVLRLFERCFAPGWFVYHFDENSLLNRLYSIIRQFVFVCYFEIGLSVVNLVFEFDLFQSSVCSRACALFSLPKIMFPILFSFLFSSPLLCWKDATFFHFCPRIFGFKGVFVDFMRHHVYMYFDYFIDYQRISYLLKS